MAVGLKPGTYRGYERKPGTSRHVGLDHESASRFAEVFGVSWTWLLAGEGAPFTAGTKAEQSNRREVRPDDKPRHFIREWRRHRGLTQGQLAEAVGVDRSYLTKIENGKRRYDQQILEAAAEVLRCQPADLIMRDPADPEGLWGLWEVLTPLQRRQAVEVIRALHRVGPAGGGGLR